MSVIDHEHDYPMPLPLALSSEQRAVLDQLCLYHEKGLSYPSVIVKRWRVAILIPCLVAAAACLVAFAGRIPPFISTFICGLVLGAILRDVRYSCVVKRLWPIYEAIIDWKIADRLRREVGLPGVYGAYPLTEAGSTDERR